ncbi:very long chain fatty acid elongase 7-like [Cloeon dipterum]|uniref:very long chain fatty acid elongase 7-like n=1 Tax=Cloeon dipterum TaxID=197152 RepID=UPI0032206A99
MKYLRFADRVFDNYFDVKPDVRSKDWFLVDNAGFMLFMAFSYLFVAITGPKIMRAFKPFDLRRPIMIYNTLMVAINACVVYLCAVGGWFTHYKLLCQPVGSADDPRSYQIVYATYIMMVSKYMELLDTVFFILRKKERQLSVLHIYHHFIVVPMCWGSIRYLPDGHSNLALFVNAFIHVVMYAYYLLSQMGPSVQKYLWWKRYLTKMQLTQFAVVILHSLWLYHPSCTFPRVMQTFNAFNCVIFATLFLNFYRKNYTAKNNMEIIEESSNKLGNMCISPGSVKQD